MEPVIRNFRTIYAPEGPSARLIALADNPPTCTMSYTEISPDKTSSHHSHLLCHRSSSFFCRPCRNKIGY